MEETDTKTYISANEALDSDECHAKTKQHENDVRDKGVDFHFKQQCLKWTNF